MEVKVLGRRLKMDEFVCKTELAQSFQRYEPFQKLLMKFGVRNEGCEILKVEESLLSLTGVKRTRGSDMFCSFFCLTTTTQSVRVGSATVCQKMIREIRSVQIVRWSLM